MRQSRRWWWVLALALSALLLTGQAAALQAEPGQPAVAPASQASEAVKPVMEGSYVLDRVASDDINRAIDTTIAKMSFFIRPIARGRLKGDNPAFKRVAIQWEGGAVIIISDGVPIRSPLDGSRIPWIRADGQTFTVASQLAGSRLTQRFWAKDGVRTNTYTVTPDGQTLKMDVAITSARLPQPLHYQLVFQRAT